MANSIDREHRLNEVRLQLTSSGYRMSPQRSAILEAMVNAPTHPSAEDVHAAVRSKFPNSSLATVYKTIDALKALNQIKLVAVAAGRAHYDVVDPTSHPHVICTGCGKTEDVELGITERYGEIAERSSGYEIREERLQFFGLCPECQIKSPSKS